MTPLSDHIHGLNFLIFHGYIIPLFGWFNFVESPCLAVKIMLNVYISLAGAISIVLPGEIYISFAKSLVLDGEIPTFGRVNQVDFPFFPDNVRLIPAAKSEGGRSLACGSGLTSSGARHRTSRIGRRPSGSSATFSLERGSWDILGFIEKIHGKFLRLDTFDVMI